MYATRLSADRGHSNFGWLNSLHTFSFGDYYDRRFMGFGPLRVINEDRVQPSRGFDTHGHRDMEILSYVLEGAKAHKDSTGTGSIMRLGDLQRMSAGTGVRHSEYNASVTEPLHFLQIWIMPERDGMEPGYEQKTFEPAGKRGRLRLIGSRDGREGSVTIHQDVNLYEAALTAADHVPFVLAAGRKGWIQVVRGKLQLDGQPISEGDGVALESAGSISLTTEASAEILLFDMTA